MQVWGGTGCRDAQEGWVSGADAQQQGLPVCSACGQAGQMISQQLACLTQPAFKSSRAHADSHTHL